MLINENSNLVVIDRENDLEWGHIDKWERRTNEDSEEYAAFLIYRDLGPLARSINSTQAIIGNHKFSNLSIIANRNKWKIRAEAWDNEIDRLRLVANERAIIEMAERHALIIESAAKTLMMPITALINRAKDDPGVMDRMVGMDTSDLMNLMIKSASALPRIIQVERLIHGQATSAQEVTTKLTSRTIAFNAKVEDLTDEQLAVLSEVFGEE